MRKLGTAVLVCLMALVAVATFGSSPSRLEAQGCGAFDGKMCASDCTRECTTGGCCAWSYFYYSQSINET